MSKVKITQSYYDKQLGFFKDPDDELEVSDERASVLVAAGVAELIVPEQKEEPKTEEEPETEEKPKGKRKSGK